MAGTRGRRSGATAAAAPADCSTSARGRGSAYAILACRSRGAPMKLFVVGFPKSGTTTLTHALEASGMKPAHWADSEGNFIGQIIYENVLAGRDPFDRLGDYDSITQADVCVPAQRVNFWPNLDFAILSRIRDAHPECLFVLNIRDPKKICSSIDRWPSLRERIVRASIPGLPARMGAKDEELVQWIENHFAACRRFFASDPKFLELDIEDEKAPLILGEALGITIADWGIIEPAAPRPEDVALMTGAAGIRGNFKAGPAAFERRRRES
jgi:Sulfotransferase domain